MHIGVFLLLSPMPSARANFLERKKMIPCNKNHVQIWHEERFCPLCTAINLVETERMYLENLKKINQDLIEEIELLKKQIELMPI